MMFDFSEDTLAYILKYYGSPVVKYKRFGPINGIDFGIGSFALEDGRCFFVCSTHLDAAVFQTTKYIDEEDCIPDISSTGRRIFRDRMTNEVLDEKYVGCI